MDETKTRCVPRAKRSMSERFGRSMIDAVIEVVIGKRVSDAGEMDDGIAILQQGGCQSNGRDRSGSGTVTMFGP